MPAIMDHDAPFASSRRVPLEEALAQLKEARALESGPLTLDAADVPTAVLNEHRQVIYANRSFREAAGAASLEEFCGRRPGEILGCIHAEPGCGESPGCRFCGAAQAIVETLRSGQPTARECHITVTAADRGPARDFMVRTTPFQIGGRPLVLVSFTDIADQKRRQSLERMFFHDIMNTASSFRVYLEILGREDLPENSLQLIQRLQAISATLVEEIQGQKVMMSAEQGTLRVQRNLIESRALAEQLVEQWEGLDEAHERKVVIAPFSGSFTFISDDALVKRILSNMAKNALEASPEGSIVSLGMRAGQDGAVSFEVHNPTCMDPLVQRQVFRRYFSTKGPDRGLGTWGMRLLAVEYLGGKVSFTSVEGEGTTFVLALPARPRDW
jgi:signal transduction histidine kinase